MHQVAWPNENCTALSYKMPETSKVSVGYTMKKWSSNSDAIVLNTENWEVLQQVQPIKNVIEYTSSFSIVWCLVSPFKFLVNLD